METKRRQYSEEFKKEAVVYSLTSGKSVKEVTKDWVYHATTWTAGMPSIVNEENWPSPIIVGKT